MRNSFRVRALCVFAASAATAIAVACGSDGDTSDASSSSGGSSGATSSGATSSGATSSGATSSSGGTSSGGPTDAASDADAGPASGFLYVGSITRSDADYQVLGFEWSNDGSLTAIDMDSTAPGVQGAPTTGRPYSVAASPSGKWVYCAHYDGLAAYAVDGATGALTHVSLGGDAGNGDFVGAYPFVVTDPKGRLVYAVRGPSLQAASLVAFTVDDSTGKLTVAREVPTLAQNLTTGAWLAIDAQARFMLVMGANGIGIHALEPATGLPLTPDGGPALTGMGGSGNFGGGVSLHPSLFTGYDVGGSLVTAYAIDASGPSATNAGGGAPINAIYPFESVPHPNGSTLFAAGHALGGYVVGDGGLLTMVSYSAGPSFCHAATLDPSGTHFYAACGEAIYVSDIGPTTGTLARRDASVPAYFGTGSGGYGISRSFAWVVR